MDYNKLKLFTLVAKYGGVSAVARIVRRSQPAVTQQIQALEEELGFHLLDGQRGKATLTQRGRQVYEQTKDWFDRIEKEMELIVADQDEPRGRLRLISLNDGGNHLPLPELIAQFVEKYPGIAIDLAFGTNDSIEPALLSERFDIGFTVQFSEPKLFHRWPMGLDRHNLYTSPGYLKKVGKIAAYEDLWNLMLIDLSDKYLSIEPWLKKNCPKGRTKLLRKAPSLVAADFRVIASILSAGYGVAMLPEYLAESLGPQVVKVFAGARPTTSGLDLAICKHKTATRCEQLLIEFFKEQAALRL